MLLVGTLAPGFTLAKLWPICHLQSEPAERKDPLYSQDGKHCDGARLVHVKQNGWTVHLERCFCSSTCLLYLPSCLPEAVIRIKFKKDKSTLYLWGEGPHWAGRQE